MTHNDTPSDAPVNPYAPSEPQRFSCVPHGIYHDERLTFSDHTLCGILLEIFVGKSSGEVSNAILARRMRVTTRAIVDCFRRLEAAGWIRCERNGRSTQRTIQLMWNLRGKVQFTPDGSILHTAPRSTVHPPTVVLNDNTYDQHFNTLPAAQPVSPLGSLPQIPANGRTSERAAAAQEGEPEGAIRGLKAIFATLWDAGEGTQDAPGLIAEGKQVIPIVLRDKGRSGGQYERWLREVARHELQPCMFWEAYKIVRDQAANETRDIPMGNFAAYFVTTLNHLREDAASPKT